MPHYLWNVIKMDESILFQENELILMSVLNCVYDSISQILRKNVEKKAVFENLVSI